MNNIIDISVQKSISLNILEDVSTFCKKNHINYYLCYGTLLGSVRHNGFIPWDDDIDIVMFRKEYNKFLDLYKSKKYSILSFRNRSFYLPYTKLVDTRTTVVTENFIPLNNMGISIDIFPLDYFSNIEDEATRLKNKSNITYKLLRYSLYNDIHDLLDSKQNFRKVLLYLYAKMFGWKFWANHLDKLNHKYNSSEKKEFCGYFFNINNSTKPIFRSSWFDNVSDYVFENKPFMSIKNYDAILKIIYGDYMSLPPENERIPHSFRAYWK